MFIHNNKLYILNSGNMQWREKEIIRVLEKHRRLKIADLIKEANMCKVTALKYLKSLLEKNAIGYERIGPTKLWFLKQNSVSAESEEKIFELVKKFEEITGTKAHMVVTNNKIVLTSVDK